MTRTHPPDEPQEAAKDSSARSRSSYGPGRPLRVVVADDHPLLLEGMRVLLQQEPDMTIVGVADCGQEAVRLASERQPDTLVLDFHLPDMDAPAVLRRLSQLATPTRVVIFSFDPHGMQAALEAGAMGYVLKDQPVDRLVEALRKVARGELALFPHVTEGARRQPGNGAACGSPLPNLTSRERDVLALLAQGRSNGETAAHLSIGIKTVETHRANLYRKLDVHGTGELIMAALRHRLISI